MESETETAAVRSTEAHAAQLFRASIHGGFQKTWLTCYLPSMRLRASQVVAGSSQPRIDRRSPSVEGCWRQGTSSMLTYVRVHSLFSLYVCVGKMIVNATNPNEGPTPKYEIASIFIRCLLVQTDRRGHLTSIALISLITKKAITYSLRTHS